MAAAALQKRAKGSPTATKKKGSKSTRNTDDDVVMEFGGPIGCCFVMLFSHVFVLYVWLCLEYNDGALLYPTSLQQIPTFFSQLYQHVIEGACPTWYSLQIYGGFILFEGVLAVFMPGLIVRGLPVPSEGNRQLRYKCNGIQAWYTTLLTVAVLQYTGWFPLSEVMRNLGPLLSTAIIFSDLLAIIAYLWAVLLGKGTRMSGNVIYDFFMGAWLNPRLPLEFDLKMWTEIRVSWIMLWLLTASAAVAQYERFGYVSGGMWFMLLAHTLYTNACMKGEECIISSWDIFYEKWGWMLIYWNLAGVPFFYCSPSVFILTHPQYNDSLPTPLLVAMFALLLFVYYVWDTAQSQRNRFRMKLRGTFVKRYTFPQLPWGTLENPKVLKTKCGSTLLIDGWWAYARKIHYTCDIVMATLWGMSCGFTHVLPYLYVCFFVPMITHRYFRDVHRCARKYGDDWKKYTDIVPYVFIPYVF